jgi:Cys-rich protein (TIGR01571 family)
MTNWQSKFFDLKDIHEHFPAISHSAINIGGLCGCFDDCRICCYGCWCTVCLHGENAQQIDGSDYDAACLTYCCSVKNILACLPIIDNRKALRNKYRLAEEPCNDCLVGFCCTPCAVCQAARELKIRKNIPGESFVFMRIVDECTLEKIRAHSFRRSYLEKVPATSLSHKIKEIFRSY